MLFRRRLYELGGLHSIAHFCRTGNVMCPDEKVREMKNCCKRGENEDTYGTNSVRHWRLFGPSSVIVIVLCPLCCADAEE